LSWDKHPLKRRCALGRRWAADLGEEPKDLAHGFFLSIVWRQRALPGGGNDKNGEQVHIVDRFILSTDNPQHERSYVPPEGWINGQSGRKMCQCVKRSRGDAAVEQKLSRATDILRETSRNIFELR
jgi:hypothetical protein